MSAGYWLKNASCLAVDGTLRPPADLLIENGLITALGTAPLGAPGPSLDGLILAPAFTDLSAHLREPGEKSHGSIATETLAAAAGGFVQVVLPPDTVPAIDSPAIVALVHERAAASSAGVRVLPLGALTRSLEGNALSNMAALKAAGCCAVSQARRPVASPETWLRCLEYAASQDLTVFFAPEDASLAQGCAHDGFMAARLGLPGIPSTAETVALATQLLLVAQTGVRAHFGQLSTAGSVQLLRWAKSQGLPVSADVAMHQLHLTDAAIDGFNSLAHVRPPLRSEADRQALLAGVSEGVIDAISSDHQPLDASAKLAPFAATAPGISALETVLPLGLRLVHQGLLGMDRLIDALAHAPRRILGQPSVDIQAGQAADLVAWSPDEQWTLQAGELRSLGKNTPFTGETFQGRVQQLWSAGLARL